MWKVKRQDTPTSVTGERAPHSSRDRRCLAAAGVFEKRRVKVILGDKKLHATSNNSHCFKVDFT